MNKYRDYWPNDERPSNGGDGGFLGVDMRRSPPRVGENFLSDARNARFDGQIAQTRKGVGILRWGNAFGTPFPLEFPLVFDELVGFTEVFGAGNYVDPSRNTWQMFATPEGVYIGRDNFPIQLLPLPAGETIAEACFFIQGNEVMYLYRGPDERRLQWDRTFLGSAPWVEGFKYSDEEFEDRGDGRLIIPNAHNAVLAGSPGRFFVPIGRNEYVVSDALEYDRYDPTINRRTLDGPTPLVRFYPWLSKQVIAFRDPGVEILVNVKGDLTDLDREELNGEIGLVAPLTVATVGKDVFFLAAGGVNSIAAMLDNKLQGTAKPVSEPIHPLIERINWPCVREAVAAYWNNRYYLAVPLGASTRNNAVLVYDVLNGAWTGVDDGTAIEPKAFLKGKIRGRDRLLMIDYGGLIYVYEEHAEDETADGWQPVELELLTRGYQCENPDESLFQRVKLDLETWNPSYSIAAEVPGVSV